MRRCAAAYSFLGSLVLAATAAAQVPSGAPAPRDGEIALPGRWYCEGGNAAHNGWSANPPLLHRPNVAWQQTVSGTIAGEPLVWDQHVVLALRVDPKRCGIEVRRLADGSLVGKRLQDNPTEPVPTIWGNEIVWRASATVLELSRIGKASIEVVTRMPKAKVAVGPPLRVGNRTYAAVDGVVTCMRAGDFRVLWRATEGDFAGPMALAGDELYAVRSPAEGPASVVAFDRVTGTVRARSAPFSLVRAPGEGLRMQLAGNDLFVRFGDGNWLADFKAPRDLDAIHLRLPLADGAAVQPESMPRLRALDRERQIGMFATTGGLQLGMFFTGSDKGMRLDGSEVHRPLGLAPPTLTRGVVYLGACAVDLATQRLLWQVPRHGNAPLPKARAVPAGRSLLFANGNTLLALREDAPPDAVEAELATAWRTGSRALLQPLVDQAIAANDWDLASDLIDRCRDLEADEAWATKREKDIALRASGNSKPDPKKAATVRAAADAGEARSLDAVHAGLAAWTSRSALDRRHALRFVLRRSPAHAAAIADVRAMLPAHLAAATPFHALDWLDFLDASAHTEVKVLEAAEGDLATPGIDAVTALCKQQLLTWRDQWRKDLQALRSERVVLFSPVTSPGSLAKAMATGELVCDLLESMFGDLPVVRTDLLPMLVFIYADKEEYLAESKKIGADHVEWTAGYYSDSLNETVAKSRLFVPDDDVGFADVLPTLAHELTHQWLMDRCHAFVPDPIAVRVGNRGFWVVEGFANLVAQFDFDFARRQFRLGNGQLLDADLVVSTPANELLPWDKLVGATRLQFARITRDRDEIAVPSRLHLGHSFSTRRVNLFYAQSAMLARYLYEADGGKHRRALLDYVVAFYTGKTAALDFATAFGATPAEFGPRVVAFSKALLE